MKRRKPYAEEFKKEAVKLVTEQGMGVTHVARDLDVSFDTLHRWLREARSATNPATTDDGVSNQEIARLKREVEQLRMERDILKKALGIFSRMPQ
jgi:transposase